MVNRYVKLLPQPRDDDAAERLNAYLRARRRAEAEAARRGGALRCSQRSSSVSGNSTSCPLRTTQIRLHVALEVADAHPERGRGLLSRERVAGYRGKGRVELVRT